ncbi:glycosyltransferase family 4 protein [Chloroflexia bacterium SDU3-3]|nr:glycosyltransferase family 4 protein [Chloroflexia bacterium SDU3-3]
MVHTILMIAPTSFFADYGNHIRIWQEAQALQKRGHRVVLTTYHNGDDMPGLEIHRSWDVPWIKRAMVGSSRHKIYLDMALSYRALDVALRVRPTIIHAHIHEGALIGAALRRITGLPMVFDFQGSLTSEMLDHGFLKSKRGMAYQPLWHLERWINRQADALITSSHNAAELLRRDFGFPEERLYTVIDGINTDRFRPSDGSAAWDSERRYLRAVLGIPEGRKVVVYLGVLAPYQGIDALMEAAQQIIQRQPDTHFLIMGYPGVDRYRALAESLGLADHVTLPGRILYRDAHAYLSLGDVAVAPKMSETEGSGKIPNYMAMGLPVVTFDTPVSREYLGDLGIYARFGSVDDLADKIAQALADPERAGRLGALGRQKAVHDLSSDRAGPEIEAVYEAAIANRARASRRSHKAAAGEPGRAVERH